MAAENNGIFCSINDGDQPEDAALLALAAAMQKAEMIWSTFNVKLPRAVTSNNSPVETECLNPIRLSRIQYPKTFLACILGFSCPNLRACN